MKKHDKAPVGDVDGGDALSHRGVQARMSGNRGEDEGNPKESSQSITNH